jgi:hypothetical protein
MSDVSQGPGWWLASDGKWYRPEQHPNFLPPASPSPPAQVVSTALPPSLSSPPLPDTTEGKLHKFVSSIWARMAFGLVVLLAVVGVVAMLNGKGSTSTFQPVAAPSTTDASIATTTLPLTSEPPVTAPAVTAPPVTTPPVTTPPVTTPTQSPLAQWDANYNSIFSAIISSIEAWDGGVQQFDSVGDSSGITQACGLISTKIQAAEALPPIPDATAEADFQQAITYMKTGYPKACSPPFPDAALVEGHSFFEEGNNEILATGARMSEAEKL